MPNRPIFFSLRSLALAAAMVTFYTIIVSVDFGSMNPYANSYKSRIGLYASKLDTLALITSWKKKMFLRHMANVEIPQYIVQHLQTGDTVLLPPWEYAERYIEVDPTWTDPRVFTYMVGFQPIVAYNDSVRRKSANTYVILEGASIWLAHRGGNTNIDSLLTVYEQMAATNRSDIKWP